MGIIIIEGTDLSGKSTAIEKLSKKLNSGFVLKNAYKPKTKDDDIFYQYDSILAGVMTYLDRQPDHYVILDRFFPSQAVYSYMRGQDELESERIQIIDAMFANMGTKYIMIEVPLEVLKERYALRGDEHITMDQLELLKSRYETFYDNTKMDKIRINTMQEGWLIEVEKFLRGDET